MQDLPLNTYDWMDFPASIPTTFNVKETTNESQTCQTELKCSTDQEQTMDVDPIQTPFVTDTNIQGVDNI